MDRYELGAKISDVHLRHILRHQLRGRHIHNSNDSMRYERNMAQGEL